MGLAAAAGGKAKAAREKRVVRRREGDFEILNAAAALARFLVA